MDKKITGIIVTAIFDDGDFVTESIGSDDEFVSDLQKNIRVKGTNAFVIPAMIYLTNLGSKAVTGINPKDYENGIKTHFGDTIHINEFRQVNSNDWVPLYDIEKYKI